MVIQGWKFTLLNVLCGDADLGKLTLCIALCGDVAGLEVKTIQSFVWGNRLI